MKVTKTPRGAGAGPINILVDGFSTPVGIDTVNPDNTVSVPVQPFGQPVAHVAIATDISNVAYTDLILSTTVYINEIAFISTMQTPLILAFGAAGLEQDKLYIGQDGLDRQAVAIPIGTRLSVKAVQAPTEGGLLLFNAFA